MTAIRYGLDLAVFRRQRSDRNLAPRASAASPPGRNVHLRLRSEPVDAPSAPLEDRFLGRLDLGLAERSILHYVTFAALPAGQRYLLLHWIGWSVQVPARRARRAG